MQKDLDEFVAALKEWFVVVDRANARHAHGEPTDKADEKLMDEVGDRLDVAYYAMSDEEKIRSDWLCIQRNVVNAVDKITTYLAKNPGQPHPPQSDRGWAKGLDEWSLCRHEIEFLLSIFQRDFVEKQGPTPEWIAEQVREQEEAEKEFLKKTFPMLDKILS
jgi:hypothetical protein